MKPIRLIGLTFMMVCGRTDRDSVGIGPAV